MYYNFIAPAGWVCSGIQFSIHLSVSLCVPPKKNTLTLLMITIMMHPSNHAEDICVMSRLGYLTLNSLSLGSGKEKKIFLTGPWSFFFFLHGNPTPYHIASLTSDAC